MGVLNVKSFIVASGGIVDVQLCNWRHTHAHVARSRNLQASVVNTVCLRRNRLACRNSNRSVAGSRCYCTRRCAVSINKLTANHCGCPSRAATSNSRARLCCCSRPVLYRGDRHYRTGRLHANAQIQDASLFYYENTICNTIRRLPLHHLTRTIRLDDGFVFVRDTCRVN